MNNIPFISYIRRYWLLLILFFVALGSSLWDAIFQHLGMVIYFPMIGIATLLGALILRHFFYSKTLDADVDSGFFVDQWQNLSGRERVILNLGMTAVLFIGLSLIAAALIK